MDKKEFDEVYKDQNLEGLIYKIQVFKELDFPKIKVEVPQGYAHTPEQNMDLAIRYLGEMVEKGYETVEDMKREDIMDYIVMRLNVRRLHNGCGFSL